MDPEERLLSHVGGVLGITEETVGDVERIRLVLAEQLLEGVRVSSQMPIHQTEVRIGRLRPVPFQACDPQRQRRRPFRHPRLPPAV